MELTKKVVFDTENLFLSHIGRRAPLVLSESSYTNDIYHSHYVIIKIFLKSTKKDIRCERY